MFFLKPKFIISLAIISGIMATYGVSFYLKEQKLNAKEQVVISRPVVIAAQDLKTGTVLDTTLISVREWPLDIIPIGSFTEKKPVAGRVLRTDVLAGEAILAAKLAPSGSMGGVSSMIPTGMRAITVAVNVVSGVAGFILPDARVDVLTTVSQTNSARQPTTKTILQNVLVLAVDQTYRKNDSDPVTVKSVTLLVTPEEAEKLTLASTEGKLQLVLRNTSDEKEENTRGVDMRQLIRSPQPVRRYTPRPRSAEPDPPKKKEVVSPRVVEVLRSNEKTEVTFDRNSPADSTR